MYMQMHASDMLEYVVVVIIIIIIIIIVIMTIMPLGTAYSDASIWY